ncbi:ribosomal protein L19 [Ehrlichia chaffeensis str. Heartland]|uniref:Large ribosomal subunit protein bL19 n=1 Tax=Ehrlichia chaffeensis (strain ATCC CRL-10679 / Arkansas) TaxID=205920 RepID=RL19_EHRCR|nr:50S ribosomal protein L19 [Ehrlichia chaffeensis]Q2GI94.1 RecName: Full=Large ribosomal subunit protein bL19; AltName: Full=50S ribosomal protein L19 [Ehrlichia chaffeensis str. Arkansas]ABD45556.1 ribosomal protein L19 [Ehrlichia chaffeensis str. Arkansas]AHX03205.1 ribosomal protein L19 [Ehrlichia chaffeensis str. Heartland]AHX05121.1 ribosomal protein L19 [Ehrlichia chaffeensis str. Jax]AHX06110.1 ribosomal protein L19 [Ehrlichia chaffeensis str. Liberty]AHX08061.1 ribosomal protein L19
MSDLLKEFNEQQMKLLSNKEIPKFSSGDTLRVSMKIFDGVSERLQVFEGVCIKRKNNGLHSSFTLRKISYNESIQLQVFLYSPIVESIEVIKFGRVRRAKLYYMLSLFGKSARIKERSDRTKKLS